MTSSDDLDDFFSVLNQKLKIHRQTKRQLDRFLSTDFNIFTFIKPDEKRLSNVIANLLNPASSHGQQRVFLNTFLRRIGKDNLCDAQPPQVATEYPIENPKGSIDVLVDFRAFVIAIENKPRADDGDAQLSNYLAYLKNTYKDRFCLIYLTQKDRLRPTSKSIEEDECSRFIQNRKLLLLSYNPDILEWLRECSQLCESDKFRGFLRDFMNYIPTMEGSMSNSSERKMIVEHALENKENLEIALDINSAFKGELHGQIIIGFLNKLENFVLDELQQQRPDASKEWCINNDGLRQHPRKRDEQFSFGKVSWGNRHGVILSPADYDACAFAMGVWTKDTPKPIFNEEDRLRKKLTDQTAKFDGIKVEPTEWTDKWREDKHWVWHCCLKSPYRNWNTKEALIKLQNDEKTVHDLGSALVKIIKAIDEHVRKS